MRVVSALSALSLLAAIVLTASGRTAVADEPPKIEWEYEGFAAISEAAAEAKAKGRRLLLGLSGGAT